MGLNNSLRALVLLPLVGGCEQEPPHEPNWLYQGEWIDIDGQGRDASETCAGSFEYLDAYAGALSVEFGANQHVGVYRWYSPDAYDTALPCGEDLPYPYACALDDVVHTAVMPHEHEVVHVVNHIVGECPKAIAEGLAVFYTPIGSTPDASDLGLLAPRLQDPSVRIPLAEYDILGKFVAFLVREHGLDAVLEVCSLTGRYPSGSEFSSAMVSVLGASPTELIDQLSNEPTACDSFDRYQSQVFACGAAEAAPDLGVVGDDFSTTLTLDCAAPSTAGRWDDSIWIAGRVDFASEGIYILSLLNQAGEVPEAELDLAQCEPCGRARSFAASELIGPEQFDSGRYSLQVRAHAGFASNLELTITRIN